MDDLVKESLNQLTKEQLIWLIEQYRNCEFMIGEVCVEESKMHTDSASAVEEIRQCLWKLPELRRDGNLGAYIDFKTGKITVKQFRKILGLD